MNFARIKDIADFYNGNSINKKEKEEKYMSDIPGWNYIGTKDIDFDGCVTYKNGVVIPFQEKSFRTAPSGTVFVCSEGGSAGKKTAIINEEVCFGNKLFAVVAKEDRLIPKYFYYFTKYNNFSEQFKKAATSLMGGVSAKRFGEIQVPLTSITEQQRIVERLESLFSELDNSIKIITTVKRQLEIYRQLVLREAFAKITEKRRLQELSCLVTSGSRGWAKYYSDTGARFIRITDLTQNSIDLCDDSIQRVFLPEKVEGKRSKLHSQDVLISITANLGSIALVPDSIEESYINQHIALVRFKRTNQGKFMAYYLRSEWGQKELLRNKRGCGKMGLGLDDIRNALVPYVSDETAERVVEDIESRLFYCFRLAQVVDKVSMATEELRQSILKKAFEGELK